MPMKVRYTVADGEVVSELRNGVRKDYVPDPLGNTVALLDNTLTVTDSWEYWPYGETRSGSSATPFTFVGTLGYFKDTSSRTYVRARHYRQNLGRWQTVDPLWPLEPAFAYAFNRPTRIVDPTGRYSIINDGCSNEQWAAILASFHHICDKWLPDLEKCLDNCDSVCPTTGTTKGVALRELCDGSWPKGHEITIHCAGWPDVNCHADTCGLGPWGRGIIICYGAWTLEGCGNLVCVILHELMHFFGSLGHENPGSPPVPKCSFQCLGVIPSCLKHPLSGVPR